MQSTRLRKFQRRTGSDTVVWVELLAKLPWRSHGSTFTYRKSRKSDGGRYRVRDDGPRRQNDSPTNRYGTALLKAPYFQNATPEFRERTKASLAARRDAAARAWRKGIRIAAGTDTNLINVSTEVAALVKIGMPPMDAIKAATSQAAGCLGIASRTGSVRPGFEADLLVIDGDPLADITALEKVLLVVNDGKITIDRLRK